MAEVKKTTKENNQNTIELKNEVINLKKQLLDLEEKLKIANEEKKYLSEAYNSKDIEYKKNIVKVEESYNNNIQHLIEKHKKEIDEINKQKENKEVSLKKVFNEQYNIISRRESELQKLINFTDNVIKQNESSTAISKMLYEYLLDDMTSQKEDKGGK